MKKIINKKFDDMPCKYRTQKDGVSFCELAKKMASKDIPVSEADCTLCMAQGGPSNPANSGIKFAIMGSKGSTQKIARERAEKYFGEGVGTELKKMIPEWLEAPKCDCRNFAKKMNIWGIQGCKDNFDGIVNKLVQEKNKRFFMAWVPDSATRTVCANLVRTTISRAEKNESSKKHSWFVAVTTAPRKEATLQTSLDSMLINGWQPHIFTEPGEYRINSEYRENLIVHKERKGVWWNWIESCRYALEHSSADIIMTVQDDSLFHPQSREIAEKFMWPCPNTGFMSLYTPKHYSIRNHLKSKPERPLGINRIKTKALWGACAMVWPRKVLEQVMEHELIEGWLGAPLKTKSAWEEKKKKRREEPWTIQNSDTAIGKIMNWTGRTMWFIDPSPVQHISKYSATNHGGNTGKRNCGRCAKYSVPLDTQVPLLVNGENCKLFSNDELIV
jgi:hypothetical protein